MRNDDDRRWLYDQMKKAGVDTGTYDDFTNSLNNPEDRDWYYNKSKSLGLEVGSSDDFISMMVADQEVPNTLNNQNTPSNPNTPKEKVEEIRPVETGDTTSGVLGNDTLSAMQEIGTPLQQQRDSLNDLEGHTDNYYRAQDDWKKQREEQRNATKDWYENQGGKEQAEAMQSQAEALVEQNKSGAQRFFDRRVEEGNVLAWMLGGMVDLFRRVNQPELRKGLENIPMPGTKILAKFLNSTSTGTEDTYANARAAQENLSDMREVLNEASHVGNDWWDRQAGGLWRGAWNSALDVRTWDFGANDMTDQWNVIQAMNKFDRNEELTPSEELLLNAVAITNEITDAYKEDVSMGYRVGQSVPQSAGFYTTIALNPASGLGQSMAKAALKKYARTKFGPIGVRTIVNGTRFGGDALEALSTTITTGMPRTFNTVAERRIGQVMGAPMEDGTYQYIGHKSKDDSFAESAWKGFLSSYFENESEMLGEYLAPLKGFVGNMFARAAGDKAWAKKAVQWMTTSSDDEVTSLLNRMKGKAKINGLVGEYLEEVANNVADAAIIHDQNFSTDPNSKDWGNSVFNPEKNLETFLSVAAMIGPMKMVELGGRGYNQYSANQTLKVREQLMKDVYGKDNDNGQYIVDQFSECKDWKEMSQKFTQLKNEQMISDEREARAVLGYLSALVESQTVNTRYQSKKYHSERIGDQSKEAYDAGLGMKLQDYHKANLQYAPAKQQAHDMFGDDMAEAMVQMTPWEFNNVRMRMSPEQRQVAEAYYNQASRMKGILDKENADVNAHMDYFRNSYAPYVKRVANGDDFLMRAKYTDPLHPEAGSEDVVLLSRDGGTATILLNGKPAMVNTNTLSEFTSQTWREAQEEERNSFAKQKEQQRQWGLDHNPKTQMPYAGSTIKISSGEAGGGMSEYVTDFDMQNGMVGIVPMQFDAKAGQEVPLSTEVQQVPLEVILHLQDQYYDGLEGMSAQNTPSNPNTQNTPSEETEEGAGMAPGAAEAQLRGTQGGQQTLQQVQDWMNAGEDPETIERNIQTQIEEDYRDLALQYYREKSTPQAEPAGTVAGTPQAEPAGTVVGENGGEATAPTAPELRGKNGQLDRAMMEQNGDPQTVASALRGDFPDDAADIASEYQVLAQQEADSETEPIAKRVKARAAKFWQDVLNLLRPIAQGGPTAAEIRAQAQIEATEEAKKNFPKIVERWQNAPKKVGRKTIYRLPDGTRITGHYVLTESGAYTPSHDPHTFKPNEGFPTTDQGTTANSRDYEHDEAAQQQVVVMGQSYNGNALQDPVVVSQDGIVYSGNNRAMSGQLAAEQGTDTDYLEDLGIRAEEYGFTEEDIAGMQHPRVVFVADAGQDLDYTPKTFDRFNAQRGKGQSATEKAIKFGKILDETTFGNLVGVITKRNKLSDVYKSAEDCKAIADYLEAAGVMTSTQRVEFLDSKGLLTSQGQEALEGALIGYVFKGNEQVVRLLNQMPAVRRRIIGAINEIVTNRSLGEYSLDNELGDAIQLLYEADQSGMDLGSFYKQTDFTRDVQGLYNATTYLLATMLDGTSQKSLKDVLQSYNTGADTQVSNFGGLFGGMNRQELLEDILKALGYELRTRQGTGQEDTGGQTPPVEEGTDEGVGENEDDNDNDDDDGGENNGPKGGGTGNNSVPLPTEGETYVNSRNGERAVITGEENGTLTVEYHTPEGNIVTDTVNAEEFAQDIAYGEWTKDNGDNDNEDDNDGESGAEEGLTAEQIQNSGADSIYIDLALDYLEESVHDNSLTHAAYEYIKQLLKEQGNVRTGQDTGETGSEDADSAHLGSEDNGAAEGGIRQDGMEAGGLVDGTSQDTGAEPDGGGSRQGGTTAEGSDTSAAGEGSSSDAGGGRTSVDGVSSGNSQPRGGRGSRNGGRDVRQPEGGESGNGVAESAGAGGIDSSVDPDALIAESLQKIRDILSGKKSNKDVLRVAIVPFQPQLEKLMALTPYITRTGYGLLVKGYHTLERWTEQMQKVLAPIMNEVGLKAKEIAGIIKDCWNARIMVDGRKMKISDWAHEIRLQFLMREQGMSLNEKRAAQEAAEGIQVKVCDRENIDATLPFLMEAQREDVYKAEKQFFDPTHQDDEHCFGKGMLFTNATGTGKTYVGLGIIKRFVKQGKGRILLIVPSEAKERDWANRDAVNLGLTIAPLRDLTSEESVSATNRKGQGIVVTTFENFRDNAALLEDDFDLILCDECHKLMQNQKGQETEASKRFHMITNRDVDTAKERLKYVHPLWVEERNLQDEEASIDSTMRGIGEDPSLVPEGETYYGYIDRLRRRVDEIHNRLYELRAEQQRVEPTLMPRAQEAVNRTHVVLLSATPFSTREALRWAGGYIFNLPNGNFDDFLLRWFPESYRREGGKARPKLGDALQVNREEIAFSDRLMNELGTQSGRVSEVPFDYSRDFPVMDLVMASAFNQAYQAITRGKYSALLPGFTMLTNYESSTVLFETLKVAAVLPRIREHLAMGRKVAIYHSRRNDSQKDPISPPFRAGLDKITKLADQDPDRDNKQRIYALVQEFEQEFANLLAWEQTLDYRLPREQLADAFGADNVGFFSGASEDKRKGSEKDQRRFVDVRKFNSDDSGKDIIVCQTQSAREGIDLHDTTGKHQRVLMVLSLPTSSIEFIQIEGRIFRIGTRSNAIFEYPLLGIDLELQVFAAKINSRAATTENLALGSKARNLRQSIADGILQGRGIIPVASQGIGGKEFDNPKSVLSGIAKAIADYVNRMKGHTDESEKDSTPEPLGYTLVQWAGMNNGDRVLEPSAGRGNIARYIPAFVKGLFLESDAAKRADLMLATAAVDKDDENAGRFNFNVSGEPFENLTSNRKFDSIVMVQPANDEFSTAVKVAFGRNLENSGRLVAVVPTKQVNQLRKDMKPQGAVFVAYAKLPEVAYEDPGMKNMTVVVIDKVQREDIRSQYPKETAVLDFSGCKTMEEFFEELKKEPQVPPRIIDPLTKRIKRGEALMNSLKNNPIVEESGRGQNKSEWANFSPTTGSFYFVPKNRSRNKGENVYHLMSQRARDTYGYISSSNRGSLNYGVIENIGKEANNLAARIYVAAKDAMDKYDANNLAAYRQEVFDGNEVADDICAGMYRYQKALCRYIEEVSGLTEDQIRRAEAGESIFTHSILAPGRKLSSREFRSIFDDNSSGDAEMAEHFGIVFPLIKKEGTGLVTGRTTAGSAATYSPRTNTVSLNASVWNRLGREKLDNAVTLLHEMTHMPVAYARTAFEAGLQMSDALRGLCESLDNLFGTIMKSRESYHLKGEYGLSDADELISESSDPKVREKMKRVGLWKKSANGVIKYRVFEAYDTPEEAAQDGYSRTNAYAEAMNLLQGFVNNHDLDLAKLVSPMYEGTGEWGDTDAALEEASGRFKTSDRSTQNTPNNPGEVEQAVEETSQVLNTPIEILRNEQELEASDISAADKKVMRKKGKGMYDTKTGKVYIYLPHLRSADDARVTALHEIVGHKGLRQLFGEKDFDLLMARLFGLLPREARDLIMSRCKTEEDIPTEVDEYLAEMAELDENPSWWQKVVSAVKEFLRSKGLNIGLSENDVKYLLWQSKNQLKSGDLFTEAQRIRMRKKYGIGENDNDDDDPDGGGGGGRYQGGREVPIFYSNARRAVEGIKQEKATPEQWLAMIQKAGGLKAGEDKWLGLSEWLKGQKVKSLTKQEVLEYIMANQIQVEEVGYGHSDDVFQRQMNIEREFENTVLEESQKTSLGKAAIEGAIKKMDEKYGGNFSKVFEYGPYGLRLKQKSNGDVLDEIAYSELIGKPINSTRLGYTTRGLENKREIALVVPAIESWHEDDTTHFGDAGGGRAVAWIRFGETTDKDGNKVLVIDEIQSKRHQAGRENGYQSELENSPRGQYYAAEKAMREYRESMKEKYGEYFVDDDLTEEERKEYKRLYRDMFLKSGYKDDKLYDIPDAPFEKNWHELAMKRMLRYAAENGYDKIAWTKGEQQAARYDLKQVVESIQWKEKEGFKGVKIALADRPLGIILSVDKDGVIKRGDYGGEAFVGKPLSDVLGKDLAGRIMADEGEKHESNLVSSPGAYYTLSGDGLSIGGEGMKGFYDQILPRFMDKYGKKWGVKTGEVELPNLEEAGRKMWSVDVTPEMRESVMQGQAMFKLEDGEDVESINAQFNRELQMQIDGTLPPGHVYDMGMPSEILLSTGFPNVPIELSASHLAEKAAAAHHSFDISEIRGLVNALQHPMAVFVYGEKGKAQNVIVEIQHEGRNFVVGIHFNQERRGAIVSDIRGLYPKDNAEWLNWISQGKLLYADKEKIQNLISQQRRTLAEVGYLDLNFVAKILEDFENPKLSDENFEENEDFDEEDPVGENTSRFSTGRSTTATANATARQWDKIVQSLSFGLTEVTVDYLHAVERFQKFLADKTGKAVLYTQDVYNAMLQLSSRNCIETKKFDEMFVTPLNLAILDLLGNKVLVKSWRKWAGTGKLDFEKNPELQALDRYVKMKHGVERNRDMSVRNVLIPKGQQAYQDALDAALKPYRDDLERIEQELENNESIIESLKQELQALRASRAGSSAIQAKKDELDRARETSARLRNERAEDRRMIRDITKYPHKYGLKTLSESIEDELKSWYEAAQQVKENARANGKSWRETQEALDKEALKIPDVALEDYSGLSAMTGDGIVFTQKAYDEVEKYEFDKDADKLQHLWAAISAIADFSMLKQQESGLVGDGYFDQQKRRFDYFVPLRGWQEMTAEDVYEYVNEVNTELGNPVKAMKGRQSEAGNAFGSLLNVAYGSINHGNRNEALTKFYNLVQGHPTDIARISGGWLERIEDPDGGPDLWVAREVELDGTETEEEMIQKIDAFESEMQEKAENGDAMRDSQHGAKVPYRITKPGTLNQHQIRIHINGRTRIITIGANPRVTEALNGLLNPSISNNVFRKRWTQLKNLEAKLLTSMKIAFANGNLDRDTSFAMVNSYARYGSEFAKAFAKYQKTYFVGVGSRKKWAQMGHLLRLYNKNSLNESNPLHQQFKEFMDYGGATGYTFLVDMEQSKKKLEDMLRQLNRGALHPVALMKRFSDFIELVTQSSELTNRFSAFQAGKDLGWTRGQCIAAAKEITVNFNRKGAGTKGIRKNDENKTRQAVINTAASLTSLGTCANMFFNASIQGKYAFLLAFKSNPWGASKHVAAVAAKKIALLMATPMALGAIMPLVNDMFLPMLYAAFGWDDYPPEDESYWDFNDYSRQHYFRIRLPRKFNVLGHKIPLGWLKFSLSQELSPFFAVGDVIAGAMYGGRDLEALDLWQPFVDLVSPQNLNLGNMKDLKGMAREGLGSTPASGVVDLIVNRDFLGRPVYGESYNFDQRMMPAYTKGTRYTSPALTDFTKWLNIKSGGSERTAGKIDLNPSAIQHLGGSFGDYFQIPLDIADNTYGYVKDGELKGIAVEDLAILRRSYDSGAQSAIERRASNNYYKLVNESRKLRYDEKAFNKIQTEHLEKAKNTKDSFEQAEELKKANEAKAKLDELIKSDEYQFYFGARRELGNSSIKREMDFIKKLEDQEKKTGITNETIPEKKRALLEQWKEWKKR